MRLGAGIKIRPRGSWVSESKPGWNSAMNRKRASHVDTLRGIGGVHSEIKNWDARAMMRQDGTYTAKREAIRGNPSAAAMAIGLVIFLATAVAMLFTAGGCTKSESKKNSDAAAAGKSGERSGVAATIFPLFDLARDVAGEDFEVTLILPAGRSPHGYEMTPSDRLRLRKSEILVRAGGGVDSWVSKAAADEAGGESAGLTVISLSQLAGGELAGTKTPDERHEKAHEEEHEHHGAQGHALNPHQWLLPRMAKRYVEELRNVLVARHTEKAAGVEARAAQVMNKLDELDATYRKAFAGVTDRRMITFHDAFVPLAKEYGLEVVATIYSIESQQITPADVKRVDEFLNAGVRAVFSEPQFENRAIERLHSNITMRVLDPLGGRTKPTGYATYFEMMNSNLRILIEGLHENLGGG